MKVLFVCTGNVCRSPMAEGFLRHEAAARGLPVEVRSAGTHAWEGRPATIEGRRVMATLGVPIDDHRTEALRPALVEWADLVVGLASEHVREVVAMVPGASAKTVTLKGLVAALPSLPPLGDDPQSWAAEAAAACNGSLGGGTDVDDPIGEREAAYRRVAEEIRSLVAALADAWEVGPH